MLITFVRKNFKKYKKPLLWLRDIPHFAGTWCIFWWHGVDAASGALLIGSPRIALYRRHGLKVGRNFRGVSSWRRNSIGIQAPLTIMTHTTEAMIQFGDDCGVSGAVLSARRGISIGDRVFIGSGAMIMDSDMHDLSGVGSHICDEHILSKEIIIHDSVFIGARALILKGVTIGEGAIVGAGATVTKDVPPGSVVVPPPSRLLSRKM